MPKNKNTKHVDKIGSFDSFRAPWETEAGSDAEIDKAKLKRLIYNLKLGEATAQDAVADRDETLAETETALETAKAEAADANGAEAQKKIDKLETKLADVTKERDELVEANELAEVRAEVLGDFAEKNPKAAKYVKGKTKEELEASLAEVKDDWGITDEPNDDDPEDDERERAARTSPRTRTTRVVNPGDKGGKGGEAEIDFDKVADDYLGGTNPFS